MANYEEMQTLLDSKEREKAVANALSTLTLRETLVIKLPIHLQNYVGRFFTYQEKFSSNKMSIPAFLNSFNANAQAL